MERLSKKVRDLIENGTIKERALLVCKEWKEKEIYSFMGGTPTLNQKEVDALLLTQSNKEEIEMRKWLLIYDVYNTFTPTFAIALEEYYNQAYIMEGYLRLWEEQESKIALVNYFAQSSGKVIGDKKLKKFFDWATIKESGEEDNPYYLDITHFKGLIIEEVLKSLIEVYSTIKATILTLEGFARNNSSQKFIPEPVKKDIAGVKKGYLDFDINKKFSCKELRLREERGENITEAERAMAIFPEYNSLEVSTREREFFKKKLNNTIIEVCQKREIREIKELATLS